MRTSALFSGRKCGAVEFALCIGHSFNSLHVATAIDSDGLSRNEIRVGRTQETYCPDQIPDRLLSLDGTAFDLAASMAGLALLMHGRRIFQAIGPRNRHDEVAGRNLASDLRERLRIPTERHEAHTMLRGIRIRDRDHTVGAARQLD